MGSADAGLGAAGGVLAAEICAPLLLLCWLCCWPDDHNSDTTNSGKHPRKPVVTHESGPHRPRRPSDSFSRRLASSAVSLHLPSTSGNSKEPLSAHRSHEEIPSRRKSNQGGQEEETRYHSAPSVIHEVLHRRDWERSARDLYIPLKPEVELFDHDSDGSHGSASRTLQDSSSAEGFKSDEKLGVTCKKHYTNIKSSRNRTRKEATRDDVKDTDATEASNFYIGDIEAETPTPTLAGVTNAAALDVIPDIVYDDKIKSVYKAKDAKQSFNESIKSNVRPMTSEDPRNIVYPLEGYLARMVDVNMDSSVLELDRSGAEHHDIESRARLLAGDMGLMPCPAPSVEAVGYDYEGAACYLRDSLRDRVRVLAGEGAARGGRVSAGGLRARGRHASDGDILGPAHRPESGAFSESDLDLESGDDLPPSYEELHQYSVPGGGVGPAARSGAGVRADRKETAI